MVKNRASRQPGKVFLLLAFVFLSCQTTNNSKTNISLLDIVHTATYKEVKSAIAGGADVNEKTDSNSTPLMFSFVNKDKEIPKLLIKSGADVNAVNAKGWTPLFYAVEIRRDDILDTIKYLVKSGADLEYKNSAGQTPLAYSTEINKNEKVIKLLIDLGANINTKNNIGITPLFYAILNNTTKAVELLIKSGTDVNIVNEDNQTQIGRAHV